MWQHEPCFFGWKQGNKPKRNPGDFPTTVWQIDVPVLPGVESRHPTEKPSELFTTPILLHTQRGDVCYEPFSGSGTHLCAVEVASRRCFAMEIEPAFVPRRFASITLDKLYTTFFCYNFFMWRKADNSKLGPLPSSVSSTQQPAGPHNAPNTPSTEQPAGPHNAPNTPSAVGQGFKIKGEISGHGDLFLDGEVEGRICIASGTLTVGPNARIRAEIEAPEIILRGDVIGTLKASDRVHIWSTGKLMGDIETRAIVIDDGALLRSTVAVPQDSVRQGTAPEGSLSETDHPPHPSSPESPPRAKGTSA